MDFEFFEYFSANPSLSFEEIRKVDTVAHKRLDGSYGGVIKVHAAATAAAAEEPTTPLQSPVEGVSKVEKGGAESSKQTTTSPANIPEAEILMKGAEILSGGSWDLDNTQGFSMLK